MSKEDFMTVNLAIKTLNEQTASLIESNAEITKSVQTIVTQLLGAPGAEQDGIAHRVREMYKVVYVGNGSSVLARLKTIEDKTKIKKLTTPNEDRVKLKIVWSVLSAIGGGALSLGLAKIFAVL